MQNLDVISLNVWDILISLANLLILFLILKKFLYAPVKRVIAEREAAISDKYAKAEAAKSAAEADLAAWNEKMATADDEADAIIKKATARAEKKQDQIIADAKERADGIVALGQLEVLQIRAAAGPEGERTRLSAGLGAVEGHIADLRLQHHVLGGVVAALQARPAVLHAQRQLDLEFCSTKGLFASLPAVKSP